jgi:hypothetical protein
MGNMQLNELEIMTRLESIHNVGNDKVKEG